MRKQLLLIVVLLLTTSIFAGPISHDEARKKALTFLKGKGRGMVYSNFNKQDIKLYDASLTKESDALYIFNLGNNAGFIIINGDDRGESVLGYSDHGSINSDNIPSNMQAWLDNYEKSIKDLRKYNIPVPMMSDDGDKTDYRHPIPALVTSKWNQDSPFNDLCPDFNDGHGHRYTGCVATAMAQVMYYHKWPKEATKSIPGYTFKDDSSLGGDNSYKKVEGLPSITFNWDDMLDVYSKNSSTESNKAVAELMQYCGTSLKMDYGVYASGAMSVDIPHALRTYFGYDKGVRFLDREGFTSKDWDEIIYEELEESRPVLYSGIAPAGGHQFVCDGYDNGFYHINWGWGGVSDGYFKLDVLNPNEQLIGGAGNGMNFAGGQEIVIGIQPPVENSKIPYGGPAINWMTLAKHTDGKLTKTKGGMLKMTVNSRFAYHGEQNANYTVGFGLYDDDENLIKIVKEVNKMFIAGYNDTQNEVNGPVNIGKDEIAKDGTYYLKPMATSPKTGYMESAPNSDNVYFKLEVKGSEVTVTQYPYIDIETSNISLHGLANTMIPLTLKADIKNTGKAFDGTVELVIDGKVQSSITERISLDANESEEVALKFNCPKSGEVRLGMVINGWKLTDEITVNINKSETSNAKLLFTPCEGYTSELNDFDITTTVDNVSQSPYVCSVKAILYTKSGNHYTIEHEQFADVNLKASESGNIVFHFDNLDYNTSYYLGFVYYSGMTEIIYGGVNKKGEPLKVFSNFKTHKALTYYDYRGIKSYDVLNEGSDITIPDNVCYVEIPNLPKNTVVKKSANPNCCYIIGKFTKLPEDLKGCNIITTDAKKNIAETINLYDTNDFYIHDLFDVEKINAFINIENQLELIWLPFEPETVTCNGNVLKKAEELEELEDNEADFILLPCVAEDPSTIYFDFDSDYTMVPYIVNVNKQYVGREIVFSASDVYDYKMISGELKGKYFNLYRSHSYQENSDVIYNYTVNEFAKDDNKTKPFRVYAKSHDGITTDKINVSYPERFVTAGIINTVVENEYGMPVNIYSVDGTVIRKTFFDENMLVGLPSGIYIVNGRKYIK